MQHDISAFPLGDIDADLVDALERQGRGEDATAILSGLVAAGTEEPSLCIRLAHVLERRGDIAGAEVAFRRAREIDPSAADANIGLAALLERTGRRGEAIEVLDRLAKAEPRALGIQIRLGQVLIRAGELDGAEAVFRRAIEIDDASVECRRALADVLDALGRPGEAAEIMRQLTSEQSGDAELQARLGRLLIRAADLVGAEAAFRRAIELDPASLELWRTLADVLDAQGRTREGSEILQRLAAEQTGDARLFARLGKLSIQGSDLAVAEAAYRRAIALDPASVESRHALVDVLDAQGRAHEGSEILQRLAAEQTGDARLYVRLGQLSIRAADLAGAEAAYRQAIALDPASVESRRALADVLDAQGRAHEGAEILQLLAAEQIDDAPLYARLGKLLIRADDLAGAEAALRRAVELEAAPTDTWHDLANVLNARGRRAQAITILQRLVAAGRHDERLNANLGEKLRQQGDRDGTTDAFAATAPETANAGLTNELAA